MRKMKKVFAALLLLFVTNTLMAQSETYTLKGSLKDANDGAMMPYSNCVLLHLTDSVFAYGVTSDDKGAFYFKGIEGGFHASRQHRYNKKQRLEIERHDSPCRFHEHPLLCHAVRRLLQGAIPYQ